MKRSLLAFVLISLYGCSREEVVTPQIINAAEQVCSTNGGVKTIRRAHAIGEVNYCGRGCYKDTGMVLYSASVSCKNGAQFSLNFKE